MKVQQNQAKASIVEGKDFCQSRGSTNRETKRPGVCMNVMTNQRASLLSSLGLRYFSPESKSGCLRPKPNGIPIAVVPYL
jgi:hypothetical protein